MDEKSETEAPLQPWIEPEVVEMSVQLSAASATGPRSDGAPGLSYHRS